MSNKFKIIILVMLAVGALSVQAYGFGEIVGACEPDCTRCHKITIDEAAEVVKKVNPEVDVMSVGLGPVGGLWEIVVKARGKRGLAYIDFSKRHIITGSIIEVESRDNVTEMKLYELSKVDVSAIPLEEALVMGDPDARYRVIVFDDPD